VFNLQGSELIIILLLALVVLGPEKLPDAMRKAGKMYADLKKMASGFQQEFNAAVEEPLREARETADLLRDSADFSKLAEGDRDEKPKSAEMGDVGPLAPADPDAVPVDDVPFSSPSAEVGAPTGTDGFASLPALDTDDATDNEAPDEAPDDLADEHADEAAADGEAEQR
jgi:sec-independent protein translocase protein TatB